MWCTRKFLGLQTLFSFTPSSSQGGFELTTSSGSPECGFTSIFRQLWAVVGLHVWKQKFSLWHESLWFPVAGLETPSAGEQWHTGLDWLLNWPELQCLMPFNPALFVPTHQSTLDRGNGIKFTMARAIILLRLQSLLGTLYSILASTSWTLNDSHMGVFSENLKQEHYPFNILTSCASTFSEKPALCCSISEIVLPRILFLLPSLSCHGLQWWLAPTRKGSDRSINR